MANTKCHVKNMCQLFRVKILFAVFLLTPGVVHCQNAIVNLFAHAGNVRHLDSIQGLKSGRLQIVKEYHDFLEHGILQASWKIEKNGKGTGYRLMALSYNGSVFLWELFSVKKGERTSLNVKNETGGVSTLNLNMKDIDTALLDDNGSRSVFGTSCGNSAEPTREGKLMLEYVRQRKIEELKEWLNCINPVKRVYAYFGFTLLEQKGALVIDESTRNVMRLIYASPVSVYTCSGCLDLDYKLPREILTEDNERILNLFSHLAYH